MKISQYIFLIYKFIFKLLSNLISSNLSSLSLEKIYLDIFELESFIYSVNYYYIFNE